MDVQRLVESILELDWAERIEFVQMMKDRVAQWKEKYENELKWMGKLEELGFKK